jgi:hypothetical protein
MWIVPEWGRVLEMAPNPRWVSGQVSKLLIVIIERIKYPFIIYNHGSQIFKKLK